jgi:hypothetical protein
MRDALQWLLGLERVPDWASGGSSYQVQFQSLPEGVWAIGCALLAVILIALVVYLYRTEASTVRPAMRLALVTTRVLVLTFAAFMLFEMVLVITKREAIPSHLLVLVDTSQSMGLSDSYRQDESAGNLAAQLKLTDAAQLRSQPRLELARRVLENVLAPLTHDREIVIYGFAQQPVTIAPEELKSLQASGTSTAIGAAISTALAERRGQPMAGVLVLSDGQSNAGEDARKAAEQAGNQGVPIVSVTIGTEEGPANARLAALEADPLVFVRDPTEIGVLVETHGMEGRTGVVTLEKRGTSGWEPVGREEVAFDEPNSARRVSFRITPENVEELEFRAQVSELGAELTDADNFATHAMKVVRQQIRVLLIAGSPSPEVQFLRNSLMRDTGIEFASWLQSAGAGYEQLGTRPLQRLPSTRQELEQFDVLILCDPDMQALGPAWSDLISQFVGTSGGGLVFVAGEMHTRNLFDGVTSDGGGATGSTINNSWLRTLPVVADPGLYRSNAEVALSAREVWNLELTPEGSIDSIFQFDADPGRNREILASLPGMYWHFPVTRAKPGGTVLARHGDPRMRNTFGRHALFAIHRYGPGHAAFLAFDSTYRWRYLHEEYFDGFWARLIDRVGRSKALGGRYPFTLTLDKSVYRTGDRVSIQARSSDAGDTSSAVLDLRGEVEAAGQPPVPLELEPRADEPGVAQGTFTPSETGVYSVRVLPGNVASQGADPSVRPATVNFRVESAHSELDRPKLDRALLEDLAKSSGGRVFSLADHQQVPEAFKIRQIHRTLEYRDEMWDAPIIFGSLMFLLTLEWVLRKRSRMA